MPYAELHCLSNFSFLRGASRPEELVARAVELGYGALALTDECSVAGVVRAHTALKEMQPSPSLRLIVGTELRLACGTHLVALAADRRGYGQLCRLITRGRRAAEKGSYRLGRADLEALVEPGPVLLLWVPPRDVPVAALAAAGQWLRALAPDAAWIAVELLHDGADRRHLAACRELAAATGLPLVAAGDVHMHVRERRQLQDALTAIRHNVPLVEAGLRLQPSGERYLREPPRLAKLYPRELLDATLDVAARCTFSLDELRYEYPREIVPAGHTPASWLRALVEEGGRRRWPAPVRADGDPMPPAVRALVEHELALIADLQYEPYFLTVQDIVAFARAQGILCQGRGSAANSAVCYCLGVTEVDPSRMSMLVERFISRERNEPPDIDIDFEHERREEVIQYVYRKYGRERAALAATVICYRPRSALRDLGKALGLDPVQTERLAGAMQWWDGNAIDDERVREAGFDPGSPVLARLLALARELLGFPRHLSQHVGGFVIARDLLEELVPVENAAMPDRTVIQWDKDDLDDLKLLKVDLLGLGMLTALRRALDLVSGYRARVTTGTPVPLPLTMADIPAEDPLVYDMICDADTVGVFQIESRAQMAMLPRLRPRNYYDLVIEVALVRPGPIQGDMVHPYLRRRSGEEQVKYPSPEVEGVLQRTLGVPIFQEQVMQLAVVAAGFTPGEADRLRRAMAAWKRRGGLGPFERRLIDGMRARGYSEAFARQIFNQILGFGEYGFPESHAASFALLVYVSAWLKRHEPAAFCAALLNSQPMGFYSPSQLVRDARAHGVEVRPVDACVSDVSSSLEPGAFAKGTPVPALRLGLGLVRRLSAAGAARIVAAREDAAPTSTTRGASAFSDVQDLARRAALDRSDLEALAAAGALASLTGNRHQAFWGVAGTERELPLAPRGDRGEGTPLLPVPTEGQNIVADYRVVGLTLGRHPVALLRPRLERERMLRAAELAGVPSGRFVRVAGIVITRQRPGSAGGVTFVTLEDETGHVNLVVWERVGQAQRRALVESRLMEVRGQLQREGVVTHVIAHRLVDRTSLLGALAPASRDFH
jgi:error-prone DNA polymerase